MPEQTKRRDVDSLINAGPLFFRMHEKIRQEPLVLEECWFCRAQLRPDHRKVLELNRSAQAVEPSSQEPS